MVRIHFMPVGVSVLVTLIVLSIAVSPVHARMGGICGGHGGGSGHGGSDSAIILDQMNDVVTKYNGNHTGLMQAISGEFGNTFYIIVKNGFMSRSKYVYEGHIDSQGYVRVWEIGNSGMGMPGMMRRRGGGGYDCDSNICITTTRHDVKKAYDDLMANSNDYLTLDDLFSLSSKVWKTWFLNGDLFDDIISWIQNEYLGSYFPDPS